MKRQLEQHITPKPETVTARTVEPADPYTASVTDRQERIEGFDQETFSKATVLLVGAGAVGGEIGEALVWKGIGELHICDEDTVDVSNLSRQKFQKKDVGENKAIALAQNLAREGTTGTRMKAYPYHFQDAVAQGYRFDPDIVVCAPDNDEARLAVARQFLGTTPVVYTGLDQEANGGYVFVQQVKGACFRCFRPDAGGGGACPGTPAGTDPAKTIAGIAVFAVDPVLLNRYSEWDVFELFLSGLPQPTARTVEARADCALCQGQGGG